MPLLILYPIPYQCDMDGRKIPDKAPAAAGFFDVPYFAKAIGYPDPVEIRTINQQ